MSYIEVDDVKMESTERYIENYGYRNFIRVSHHYRYQGNGELKYLTFTYVAINAVGDAVCDLKGETEVTMKKTGPIFPSKMNGIIIWDSCWLFSNNVKKIIIKSAHLQFMDGHEEFIDGKKIEPLGSREKREEEALYAGAKRKAEEERKVKDEQLIRLENANIQTIEELLSFIQKNGCLDACSDWYAEKIGMHTEDLKTIVDYKLPDVDKAKLLKGLKPYMTPDDLYHYGDELEKVANGQKGILAVFVFWWKEANWWLQNHSNLVLKITHIGVTGKYARKIRKYEPSYERDGFAGLIDKFIRLIRGKK